MTIFERLWNWLADLVSHFYEAEAPAVVAWLKQFATDEGKVILQDAAEYGPKILSGEMTIVDAAAKLMADLAAKGLSDVEALREIVFNALRTQTNLAAVTANAPAAE